MKTTPYVWIISAICAALIAASLIFTRGIMRIALCIAAAAAWTVLFIRYLTLRYRISDDEIQIMIGIFFRSRITIKRSAILSQSRLYLGKHLICTIVRTAGKTAVLYLDLNSKFLN